MKLSIITTLYYSSPYIDEFYTRISHQARKITDNYEIIIVDDGSPDDSLAKAIALHQKDSKVKVIELSKNFGHHKAIMTGLSYATGDFVFLIDSDLEEEPELLGKFWKEMQRCEDVDVVYGVQEKRKGKWFERWSGGIFWKIFNFLSETKIPNNITTLKLMKQPYVKALTSYQEREFFLGGASIDCGFNQKSLLVFKHSTSETTYTFRRKIALLINSITSFSKKPLIYIFNIGFIITFFSFLYILKLVFDKLYFGISFQGWTSLIVSIWFFGGLIILLLGIIGIYISKIFIEVKHRPFTIVRNIYDDTHNKSTLE